MPSLPNQEGGEAPPVEWLLEHFTYDGNVTYCPICRGVPLIAFAGGCAHGGDRTLTSLAGHLTPWVTEPVDPFRLSTSESEDYPGSWFCFYEKPSDSSEVQEAV